MKRNMDMIHKALTYIYEAATYAEIAKEDIEEVLDGEQYDEELWDEEEYWEDLYDRLIELTTEIEERYNLIDN